MAVLKKIGPAVNDAEEWAAKFLADNLPKHYRVYSNFLLVADGQPYEVDLAVLADHTIHFLDVKGFFGEVSYDQQEFRVDGHPAGAGALGKISYLARCFPREWKKFGFGSCPWSQGAVFVTGNGGKALDLQHPAGQRLDVHGPDSILEYLKTSRHSEDWNKITDPIAAAFERLLNMPPAKDAEKLSDFHLIPKTVKAISAFVRVQEAKHSLTGLPIIYQLFIVDRQQAESAKQFESAVNMLSERHCAMMVLRGIPGVPRCLPPFYAEDHRLFVFPVEKIAGKSLATVCQDTSVLLNKRIDLFLTVVRIVNEACQRDIYSSALDASKILVTDSFEPVVFGWSPGDKPDKPRDALAEVQALAKMGLACFTEKVWENEVVSACPELAHWCEEVLLDRYLPLEQLLSALDRVRIVEEPVGVDPVEFELRSGALVNGHYELLHRLGEGSSGEVWAARHLLGDFQCCVKILNFAYGEDGHAKKEFETLSRLFHPNVVRLFSFEQIRGSDRSCLVMGMGDMTLREIMDSDIVLNGSPLKWFEGLLSAIQYLHRLNPPVLHGDIKPRSIVVTDNHASLIDFNLEHQGKGALRYQYPNSEPAGVKSDLYSLCLCFYELLVGYPEFCEGKPDLSGECPAGFPARVFERIKQVLAGRFPEEQDLLKEWFLLSGFTPTHEQPLPEGWREKWKLYQDEEYIISTLLQHDGQLTKKQLVAEAAKWAFGHVGKKDKDRINPRLSRLRDLQLIDYPQGRQKRGAHVYVEICNQVLMNNWKSVCG